MKLANLTPVDETVVNQKKITIDLLRYGSAKAFERCFYKEASHFFVRKLSKYWK